MIPTVTSKDNPLLKTVRLVASGARRAPKQLVVAEGVRVLEEVEKAACAVKAVIVTQDFGSEPREQALLQQWHKRNLEIIKTGDRLFQSISTVHTPQGAIALVQRPDRDLTSLSPPVNALILYACGIQDPGNLGTLIRTAAAAGAHAICTSLGTVSAGNPKTIRSSAGAVFRVPLVEHTADAEFIRFCERFRIRLYRTHAREGVTYTEADLTSSCAILLGNEGAGVGGEEFSAFPAIRIPMAEDVESLNVAIAGSVILFEASRQRRNIWSQTESL